MIGKYIKLLKGAVKISGQGSEDLPFLRSQIPQAFFYPIAWVRSHVRSNYNSPKAPLGTLTQGNVGDFLRQKRFKFTNDTFYLKVFFYFPFPWPTRATDVKTTHSVPQKGHWLFLLRWSHKNRLCQEARGKAQTSKRSVICLWGQLKRRVSPGKGSLRKSATDSISLGMAASGSTTARPCPSQQGQDALGLMYGQQGKRNLLQ